MRCPHCEATETAERRELQQAGLREKWDRLAAPSEIGSRFHQQDRRATVRGVRGDAAALSPWEVIVL